VGVVDRPVEDRVGGGSVPDPLVPLGDRELAGDDGRGPAVAILEHLKQIVALDLLDRAEPQVVEDQHIGLRRLGERARVRAVVILHQRQLVDRLEMRYSRGCPAH
jgi:hypothetical protein